MTTLRSLTVQLVKATGQPVVGARVQVRQVDEFGRPTSDFTEAAIISHLPLTAITDEAGLAVFSLIPSHAKQFGSGYEVTATAADTGEPLLRPPTRIEMPDEDTTLHAATMGQ